MNCKLIFLDLDGTLNNDEKRITDKTYSALMDAQKQGVRIAQASARHLPAYLKSGIFCV